MINYDVSADEIRQQFQDMLDFIITDEDDVMCRKLKLRIDGFEKENRTMLCSVPTEEWMSAPRRFVHGGIIATIMDQSMGLYSCTNTGGLTPTISLQISYLRSVPINDRMCVRVRLGSAGRSVNQVTAEAWMESEPGCLVATSSGSFHVRKAQQK